MTLYELTEQESGIIVRENAVIVTNWLHSCPSGGLPLLSPWGDDLIEWPSEIVVKSEYYVGDIGRSAARGCRRLERGCKG